MSYRTGPKIVTDGLVLCLDAADRNSYAGSGSTWNDLSGNANTASLYNSPNFIVQNGGLIDFDGINDYGRISENSSIKTTSSGSMTRAAWFMRDGSPGGFSQIIWHKRTNIGLDSVPTYGTVSYEIYTFIGGSYTGTGMIAELNTWYYVVITYNNTSLKIYVNGELKATSTKTLESQDGINMDIAAANLGNYGAVKIAKIEGYNYDLSASQVLQNYNATKGRFGL